MNKKFLEKVRTGKLGVSFDSNLVYNHKRNFGLCIPRFIVLDSMFVFVPNLTFADDVLVVNASFSRPLIEMTQLVSSICHNWGRKLVATCSQTSFRFSTV